MGPDLHIENLLWLLHGDWVIQGQEGTRRTTGETSPHASSRCRWLGQGFSEFERMSSLCQPPDTCLLDLIRLVLLVLFLFSYIRGLVIKVQAAKYVFQSYTLNDLNPGLSKLKAHFSCFSFSTVRKTSREVYIV